MRTRKKISESNIFPDFDLFHEYQKIDTLLSETKTISVYNNFGKEIRNYFTIEEFLEYVCFNDWKLRGTFTSIAEMREGLGVSKDEITEAEINENQVLDFLQYALNCINRVNCSVKNSSRSPYSDDTIPMMIWNNIEKLVERLKCVIKCIDDEFFIVYGNVMAEVVSVSNKNLSESIMEYLMIDNRGDLKRKAEILCTLYKALEGYADVFKGTTYKGLFEDTKLLFNKSGVRHNVDKDSIACATFLQMDTEQLEGWYDRMFNMFLSCMEIGKYLNYKSEVDNIKRGIID